MRSIRLYAPFIALAVIQAAFVLVAPSTREDTQNMFAGGADFGDGSDTAGGGDFGAGDTGTGGFDASTGGGTGGEGMAGGTGGTGGAAGGTSGGSAGGGSAGGGSGGAQVAGGGDTSHCKGDRQFDVIYNSPPCKPKFEGDNGGDTYPGVTGDKIRFVHFSCQSNEQVNAILQTQGLAATEEEVEAFGRAATKFINEFYETNGRELTWERVIGDCPTTPPDPARARQAAAEVAKTKPAFVYVAGGGSSAADVFAQNGIVAVGVQWNVQPFYAGRRPFRWDIFPHANETAEWMAEYYCKKLAGKPASNAGRIIHPSIGGRDTTRKLGIVVPDDGTGVIVPAAQDVSRMVKECSGVDTPIFTYQSDINRANEQTTVTVAGLIDAGVTTVTCMCDPIAPVFLTQGMTRNNYFPEHMLAGMGLLDYDVLGRLYDQAQWTHAFGPSQLAEQKDFSDSDASRVWKAAGNDGEPCSACNLQWGYMSLIGAMIHMAGPNLNPGTVEASIVGQGYTRGGWQQTGGDPSVYLIKFGRGDYNAISDFREVYWDPQAPSNVDGKAGAYISLNDGRRYAGGELSPEFQVAPKPQ